ncbi:MAG: hypothetical protein NXH82_11565 [Rhodobacteraceae bacterium]|nr:hypothetical protein [Paracoccaceae bacterium]
MNTLNDKSLMLRFLDAKNNPLLSDARSMIQDGYTDRVGARVTCKAISIKDFDKIIYDCRQTLLDPSATKKSQKRAMQEGYVLALMGNTSNMATIDMAIDAIKGDANPKTTFRRSLREFSKRFSAYERHCYLSPANLKEWEYILEDQRRREEMKRTPLRLVVDNTE